MTTSPGDKSSSSIWSVAREDAPVLFVNPECLKRHASVAQPGRPGPASSGPGRRSGARGYARPEARCRWRARQHSCHISFSIAAFGFGSSRVPASDLRKLLHL